MWHVGIDLHRATVVLAAVNDAGEATKPIGSSGKFRGQHT
jgi:hypothetical protein